MTTENVKLWLNRAFTINKKVQALDTLVNQCRERSDGLSAKCERNDRGKSDTRINGTENTFIKLADIEEKYNQQKKELENIVSEISETVSLLNDSELETVLIHRYLLFHTIEQTAELMHYSPETIRRRQRKAIERLSELIPLPPDPTGTNRCPPITHGGNVKKYSRNETFQER